MAQGHGLLFLATPELHTSAGQHFPFWLPAVTCTFGLQEAGAAECPCPSAGCDSRLLPLLAPALPAQSHWSRGHGDRRAFKPGYYANTEREGKPDLL